MSYFDQVYLKRLNVDGNTRQERIESREEKEFDKIALKRTKYKATIYAVNDEQRIIQCSLQPHKWNETHLLSNIQISKSQNKLATGDVLYIRQTIKKVTKDTIWLILFVQDDITKGYATYKAICLDETINITNEYGETLEVLPAKFVNYSSNFVQDTFAYSKTQLGYKEPQAVRTFITFANDVMNKETYFEYKGKRWRIEGIDDISIDDVWYVTISEKLQKEPELKSSQDILVGKDTNFFLNGR